MGVLGRAAVTARLSWARGLESLSRVKLPSAQPEATSEAEHRPVPRGESATTHRPAAAAR